MQLEVVLQSQEYLILQPERQSQFVDFDGDGVCKFIVYADGTMITGPISLTTAYASFVGEVN